MHSLLSLATFRQSLRRLSRERGFTLTALLTLGLCIGANVAIYAVVDAVLVRPLPYPESDRLVILRNAYPGAGVERGSSSLPNYYERRGNITALESIAMVQEGSVVIGEAGSPYRVDCGRVSPEFFQTLQVPLAMGRHFTEEEMTYGANQVAILTQEFWQNHFHGAADILGRTFQVDAQTFEVIGVLSPGFRYLGRSQQFFTPLGSNPEDRVPSRRHSNNQNQIARLAPGATLAEVQAQINAFNEAQLETDPYAQLIIDAGFRTDVSYLHDDVVGRIRPTLLLLQGGVLALLAIGAVNLINLLLIRTHGRAKEFAVRQALGAGRRDLAGQILAECLLISVGGGLLGLALGAVGIKLLASLGTDQLPMGLSIAFDGRLAALSMGATVILGALLAGPILLVSLRTRLAPVLQAESRGGTISRSAQKIRHAFIITQIALAFVLLTGAGLMGVSLQKVLKTDPGFQAESVLTGSINLPWQTYREDSDREAFLARLLPELRALPGVSFAALSTQLPFSGNYSDNVTVVEGVDPAPGESLRTHHVSAVYGDYFQAMGIPLLAGRYLTDADQQGENRVVVVDDVFVRRYWPAGTDVIGRRISHDVELTDDNALTIVGVVANTKTRELTETNPLGTTFQPYHQQAHRSLHFAVSTEMDPTVLAGALREVVLRLDPTLPVNQIRVLQSLIDDSLVARRSPALLAVAFAGVALLLSAIGTYGVLAYAVGQRRREIGVRMALGALPSQILTQFLSLGSRLLAVGIGLGVAGAWAAGKAMESILFGVEAFDLSIILIAGALMAGVVLTASLFPSQQAARISPNEALRDD